MTKMTNFDMLEIEESSGNVFADLEIPNPDEYLAKAKLANRICEILEQRKLNLKAAAELLGVNEANISDLITGKLDVFSSETLFRFLNCLDQEIEIIIKPKKLGDQQPTINVILT
jgi:predicted XRE-type DNA-binding protein